MIDYGRFLSRSGESMQGSAIRKMGTLMAEVRDVVSFAPGYPAEDLFPWRAFGEIAAGLLSGADGSVLQYGPTRGYLPLREAIVGLMTSRGIAAGVDRVVVTTGSQQGLDLIARVLIDPGDLVLLELPSYTGAITVFRNAGATLAGVPQDAEGLDLDALDDVWSTHQAAGRRAKVLYLVPNFQNPTGALLPLKRRQSVLDWARRRDVLVIEDDPYKDLFFPDMATEAETRPIAADDRDGRVIYLSSFSKTLAPGFRVAWLHAPEALAAKLEVAKQAEDLCSGGLDQRVVFEACRRGLLQAHLPALRQHYQAKRDVMVRALTAGLGAAVSWPAPRGGFFLWVRLADDMSSESLLPLALARGVIFVTGSAFFVDGSGRDYLRLSFSAPAPARIEEGVARLSAAVAELAASTASAPVRA